jgi:hypothetical protein
MATNDIKLYKEGPFGAIGTLRLGVQAGSTAINQGEPVMTTLGATHVVVMTTNKPVVSTDYLVGIAMSAGTHTSTAEGTVDVMPLVPGQVWTISPKVAASWDTQAEYDALVGSRVLIDLTAGSYTILAADNSTYGCVIMPMDVSKHPGQIAFAFRNGVSSLT